MKQRTSVCTQRISAEIYANSPVEMSALSPADPQTDSPIYSLRVSLVWLLRVYISGNNSSRWDCGGLTHSQLMSS